MKKKLVNTFNKLINLKKVKNLFHNKLRTSKNKSEDLLNKNKVLLISSPFKNHYYN